MTAFLTSPLLLESTTSFISNQSSLHIYGATLCAFICYKINVLFLSVLTIADRSADIHKVRSA